MVIYHYEDYVYINHNGMNYGDSYDNYRADGGSYEFHGYTEYDTDTDIAIIDGKEVEEVPHELVTVANEIGGLVKAKELREKQSDQRETESLEVDGRLVRKALRELAIQQMELDERLTALEEGDDNGEEEKGEQNGEED